jgi:hypothetical protein
MIDTTTIDVPARYMASPIADMYTGAWRRGVKASITMRVKASAWPSRRRAFLIPWSPALGSAKSHVRLALLKFAIEMMRAAA